MRRPKEHTQRKMRTSTLILMSDNEGENDENQSMPDSHTITGCIGRQSPAHEYQQSQIDSLFRALKNRVELDEVQQEANMYAVAYPGLLDYQIALLRLHTHILENPNLAVSPVMGSNLSFGR